MNLFIFPHAGGSVFSYTSLSKYFPEDYQVKVLELPGRGKRFYQPLLTDIEDIADLLYKQISKKLDEPYCIFGHSMGSLTAYLVIRRIADARQPLPIKFFPSAGQAPSRVRNYKRYKKSSIALWKLVEKMGHISPELQANEQLKNKYEGILRADFEAYETYQHQCPKKLDVPMTALVPSEDVREIEEYYFWQEESTLEMGCVEMEGGHFYFLDDAEDAAKKIIKEIENSLNAHLSTQKP